MNSWKWRKFQADCRQFARGRLEPLLWFREMGGRLSFQKPRVYKVPYQQMGDHWVSLCHFVRFRRFSRISHRLGIQSLPGITAEQRVSLLKQIARILNVESELEFTNKPPELYLPVHPARNGKTIQIPDASLTRRKFIAFQFDGISHPQFNPTAEELETFLAYFESSSLCRIGKPLTLEESMQVLANSKLFIGVSSGMSHLAASANTPTLIFMKGVGKGQNDLNIVDKNNRRWSNLDIYKHLRRWHPYPNTYFFSDVIELERILTKIPV